jgi:hypothetical protein
MAAVAGSATAATSGGGIMQRPSLGTAGFGSVGSGGRLVGDRRSFVLLGGAAFQRRNDLT